MREILRKEESNSIRLRCRLHFRLFRKTLLGIRQWGCVCTRVAAVFIYLIGVSQQWGWRVYVRCSRFIFLLGVGSVARMTRPSLSTCLYKFGVMADVDQLSEYSNRRHSTFHYNSSTRSVPFKYRSSHLHLTVSHTLIAARSISTGDVFRRTLNYEVGI